MKLNPNGEPEYRRRLAAEFLDDAERKLQAGDFRGCVQSSQLAAENAAKAVIAIKQEPSWAHDPSPELLAILKSFGPEHSESLRKLAQIAAQLAPEHGRTTYGEPQHFATPKSLYDKDDAETALQQATEGVAIMKALVEAQGDKKSSAST